MMILTCSFTGIRLGDSHEVDAESRARLETLLEAAGTLQTHTVNSNVLILITSCLDLLYHQPHG